MKETAENQATARDSARGMGRTILALAVPALGALIAEPLFLLADMAIIGHLGINELAGAGLGTTVLQTAVGDRYVLQGMRDGGFTLGGEQSGHVVMLEHGTTGDGTLTGLMLAARVASTGRSLADLASVMTRFPQVLVNVKDVDKGALEGSAVVAEAVRAAEAELGDTGRVLLRKSGTEPVIRVMVEAADTDQASVVAERLVGVVRSALSL